MRSWWPKVIEGFKKNYMEQLLLIKVMIRQPWTHMHTHKHAHTYTVFMQLIILLVFTLTLEKNSNEITLTW